MGFIFRGIILLFLLCSQQWLFGQSVMDSLKSELLASTDHIRRALLEEQLGIAFEENGMQDSAILHFQIAVYHLAELGDSSALSRNLESIAINYWMKGNYIEAESWFVKTLKLDSAKRDTNRVAADWNNLGLMQFERNSYLKSLTAYENALELFCLDSASNVLEIGQCQLNMGISLTKLGLFDEATDILLQAVTRFEASGDRESLSSAQSTLGDLFADLGQFVKAHEYLNASIQNLQQLQDSVGLSMSFNNLGECFYNQQMIDSAQYYFNQSLLIKRKLGLKNRIGSTLANLGKIQVNAGDFQKAQEYLNRSLELQQQYEDRQGEVQTLILLARTLSNPRSKEQYLIRAKAISDSLQSGELQLKVFQALKDHFESTQDYRQAMRYANQLAQLRDSITSSNVQLRMAVLEARYNKAQKERTIAKLAQQNAEQNLTIGQEQQRSKEQRAVLILTIVAVVIAAGAIFWFLRSRASKNLLLGRTTGEIRERERIARELHDGIGSRLSVLLNSLQYAQKNKMSLEKPIETLKEVGKDVSHLVSQLYWTKKFEDGFSEKLQTFLVDWASDVEILLKYDNECSDLLDHLPSDHKRELFMVLLELTNNIGKHARATNATFYLYRMESFLHIFVSDDGKGFDPTIDYKGVGLKTMQTRIRLLKGKCDIYSDPGKGTRTQIKIPIPKKRSNGK